VTPDSLSRRVIVERLAVLDHMIRQIQRLPLHDEDSFFADSRNVHTAESCLRRALESLFDIGRHILAKGLGIPAGAYRDVARQLAEQEVLNEGEEKILLQMAGYRNRLTHLYHEVSAAELHQVCVEDLADLASIRSAFQRWIRANPHKIDQPLTDTDG
jgi:uncharacterized protein YutE (UPF0331/DUF86 family)